MLSEMSEIGELSDAKRAFAQVSACGWNNNRKMLLMALSDETGELAADAQLFTPEESEPKALSGAKRRLIMFGIADVHNHLLRLALVLNIGVPSTVREKPAINESSF